MTQRAFKLFKNQAPCPDSRGIHELLSKLAVGGATAYNVKKFYLGSIYLFQKHHYRLISKAPWGQGGRTTPPPTPPTSTTAPHLHIVFTSRPTNLIRLLYIRMQKLTPYSIRFIKKNSGGACPQTLLGRHCADGAPPPR